MSAREDLILEMSNLINVRQSTAGGLVDLITKAVKEELLAPPRPTTCEHCAPSDICKIILVDKSGDGAKCINCGKRVELQKHISKPELIQGYTAEQWQEIIDGGYLCEYSQDGEKWYFTKAELGSLDLSRGNMFGRIEIGSFAFCRPAQIKGVLRPIFVEPIDKTSMCAFFSKDGFPLNHKGSRSSYSRYLNGDIDLEEATNYMEI